MTTACSCTGVLSPGGWWFALLVGLVVGTFTGCKTSGESVPAGGSSDAHSNARPDAARVRHVSLDLTLDFAARVLSGSAALAIETRPGVQSLVLDADGIEISQITGGAASAESGAPRRFAAARSDPIRGTAVEVQLEPEDAWITIHYRTPPGAEALQWLTPEQTAGRRMPYLYTQGQAILTRTWIPLQDSPGVRVTYDATVRAPERMRVVMSADESEQVAPGVFRFRMTKPIPSYLIALACGDIERREISARCAIFADPALIDGAARELEDVEQMLQACEATFGPYRWGRYDVVILPPAFPFGGMENPALTFATPTILAGDKSLVSLIAHELAHSWSGNLVTNATWRDFWLNEGFAVYLEHRIMEVVYGVDRARMEILLGLQDLEAELRELDRPDEILHVDLTGRNPDDAMTSVPYQKGAALLHRLEQVFGRQAFDAFLSGYFDAHAFQSITTAQFLAYLDEHLLDGRPNEARQVSIEQWVYEPGLPADVPRPSSAAFDQVDAFRQRWLAGDADADVAETAPWVTHQWLRFLGGLPADLSAGDLARLDQAFDLTRSGNSEVLTAWLRIGIGCGYEPIQPRLEEFVGGVGRRKFLEPLYAALARSPDGRRRALELYGRTRDRYHAVTRRTLDELLGWTGDGG